MPKSFKKKKLLVLGTSHCLDLNGQHTASNQANLDNNGDYGDKYNKSINTSWPSYLCDKLDVTFINGSVTSFGMETYPARAFSYLQRNYNINYVLIEYPGLQRYVQSVSNQDFQDSDILDTKFWREGSVKDQPFTKSKSKKMLIDYHPAYFDDYNNEMIKKKLDQINDGAEFHITLQEMNTLIGLIPKHSEVYRKMNNMITAVMLDSYFKSQGVQPIWFAFKSSWPSKKWRNTIMKDMNIVNDITDGIPFCGYLAREWNIADNNEFYSDGYHLHSKQWRDIIVDKYLFPVLNSIINPE
jgi:hypothetical protein